MINVEPWKTGLPTWINQAFGHVHVLRHVQHQPESVVRRRKAPRDGSSRTA